MPLKLQTVICSTRPGRVGPSIAQWFHGFAAEHGLFDCELIDLASFDLPVYDEPLHPAKQQYQNEHTRAWSRSVAAADAYAFVIPEYNYCPPPSFFNALDYVYREWNYKPCGFVSYGGVSGGLRSAQLAKQLVTSVKMMPMLEGVMIQKVADHLDEDGRLRPSEHHQHAAKSLLVELAKWAKALKNLR